MLSLRVFSKGSKRYELSLELEAIHETLQLLNHKKGNFHILNNTFNRCISLTQFLHMT